MTAAATPATGTACVVAGGRLFVIGNDRSLGKDAGTATTVAAATAEVKDAPKVATAPASAEVDAAASTTEVDSAASTASDVNVDTDG